MVKEINKKSKPMNTSLPYSISHIPNSTCAGFIALMSAIIVSAVILVVTVTLSYSSFFTRYNLLDSEFKERSGALAEGCVDAALLKLAGDPSYSGNETANIGSETCQIRLILISGTNKIIETRASFQNAFTNLRVTVDQNTLAVISWIEIPHF